MHDFKIVFTLFVMGFVFFKGLAEGWHLLGATDQFKGGGQDRLRKAANDMGFFVFVTSMLLINMQASGTALQFTTFISSLFWAGAIRYFLRDGMQNLITKSPWIYTGSVSKIEQIFGSKNMAINWMVKVGFLVLFGLAFFLYF